MEVHIKIKNFINFLVLILLFYIINNFTPLFGSVNDQIKQDKSYFLNEATSYIRGFEPNLGQIGNLEGEKVKDVLFSTSHNGIDLFNKKGRCELCDKR